MKKIITKDIIDNVQSAIKGKINLKEYSFKNIEYFSIGLIDVMKHGEKCILDLNEAVNKQYLTEWKKDVGGVISKDFNKNEAPGKYFELIFDSKKTLLRKTSQEELENFSKNGFSYDYVKIGDFYYIIIMQRDLDTEYSTSISSVYDEDDIVKPVEESSDDEYEEPIEALSLFE